ncbi:MAG: branched-chain amino acid ABC transporter permease, partial [Chloroflexota bacterium]
PNDTTQSNYAKSVYIFGFFYAIMASSWALLAGISGQFSFGHMAFMGIGAYAAGLIARDGVTIAVIGIAVPGASIPTLVAIAFGALVAGIVGLLIGWLLLRLRSSYLALFTIAFSELFRIVMLTEYDYTGGSNGLSLRRLVVAENVDQARTIEYYIMFSLLVASLIVMYWIANSRIGMFLRAMREDEDAASALGVNIVFYKILIFVITSMIVGLAGAVFYSNVGSERIIPEQLEILQMSLVIAYAVVGGMESLLGAAAGAFISQYLLESLRRIPLPVTIEFDGGPGGFMLRLVLALVLVTVGFMASVVKSLKQYRPYLRYGSVVLALIVFFTGMNMTGEPSEWEPGFWRFAVFGVIIVLTLRYMRNGLLYPILQWFGGRDSALKETVSIREDGDEGGAPAELKTETEGAD